ncbi:FAD-dependent oxidoreductase [Thermodesulfobacteriota bacterium]
MEAVRDFSKIHGEKCWEPVERVAPCENACPAGINIPGFIMALAKEQMGEALKIIRESIPIPGTLGRICNHPCEEVCNRGVIDEPIGVMRLKRFAHEMGMSENSAEEETEKPEGPKIAIIGSGPAGLTAGYFLNRQGYRVTVFEAGTNPGGMLSNAIPEFILPRQVIGSEIEFLERRGLEIKTGIKVGRNIDVEDIWHKDFKAILMATGTQESLMLNLPGSDLKGILPALGFLRESRQGAKKHLRGKVVVIGGGNVAVDAARVALRQGAAQVDLACLESRDEMPAFPWEVEECEREGVRIHNALAPRQFLPKGARGYGRAMGSIEFQRVKTLKVGPDGELSWDLAEGPGAKLTIEADRVIIAVGQKANLDFIGETQVGRDKKGALLIEPETLMTSQQGIFSAGDVISGGGTAVEAVAAGRKAAVSIDAYLRGNKKVSRPALKQAEDVFKLEKKMVPSFFEMKPRWAEVRIPPENRVRSFEEIDLGYTPTQAIEEARRCLNCKMCGSCMFERGQICFDQASRLLFDSRA